MSGVSLNDNDIQRRLAEAEKAIEELKAQAGVSVHVPQNPTSEFEYDDVLPVAWTTGAAVDPDEDIQFECVFLPFHTSFLDYWSDDDKYNAAAGPRDRWTQVGDESKVKWYDPIAPQLRQQVMFLANNNLIKRVVFNGRSDHSLIEEFIKCFEDLLPSVTDVQPGESLRNAFDRINNDYDDDMYGMYGTGPKFPEWARTLKHALIPLKPALGKDGVLEYLSQSTLMTQDFSKPGYFIRPGSHQKVRDQKTGQTVHRVYFTTVEGYLGLMKHRLGLSDMGMASVNL